MFLDKLSLRNLRNIREANLQLNNRTNIIIGENASGKTTLLEAIDVLSRGRSFRTNKTEDLIQHGSESLYIGASLGDSNKKLEIEKKKNKTKIMVGGKEEKKQSKLAEQLAIQVIHPNSHGLIEGSPAERRAFMDWGLFHVEHSYKREWSKYIKMLRQRNEALKARDPEEDSWMKQLAPLGESISLLRKTYVDGLKRHIEETQKHIMPELEVILIYEKGWEKDKTFMEALLNKKTTDQEKGFTGCGPQNADIKILLKNNEAQKVSSRGQQKLIANIMLLSQSKDFLDKKGFPSIILVDDLSAELTLEMQEKILQRLFETRSQIFLTALNDSVLADILCEMDVGVFHVEHGEITQ
tara:strand:+ start:44 stop:1105 length:1062 start_codon:yes stop_codon:yes gene_type:complete